MLRKTDEALRSLLMQPISRRLRVAAAAATAAAFALLLYTRTFTLLTQAAVAERMATVALLVLPLLVMLAFAEHMAGRRNEGMLGTLLLYALCALGMLARVSFIERSSGDFEQYLVHWLARLEQGTFAQSMQKSIGEYNVLYQYLLFWITRLPVPQLYAVKAVTFIGDALLAGAAACLCERKGVWSAGAFGLVLLLPTCVLNGGMFAQCDSLYAGCAIWGLALALTDRPAGSAVCFALALAFKLQAVFLLPIVAVLWAGRKLRLEHGLIFAGTLFAAAVPALLGGKAPMEIVSIYIAQTGLHTGLNYGAPNLFGMMPTGGLDVYAYGNFGMALAFGVCMMLVYGGVRRAEQMDADAYTALALLLVMGIVYCLPRMHERYFYMADILSVCLAVRCRRMIPAAVMTVLASFACYWETVIPVSGASLLMLAAFVWVLAMGTEKQKIRE